MSSENDTHEQLMRAIHEYFEANMAWEQLKSKSKGMRIYKAALRLRDLADVRIREIKTIRNATKRPRKPSEYNEKVKERIKFYQDQKVNIHAQQLMSILKEIREEYKNGQDRPDDDQSSDK